jgi:cytochrome oxidase assembly protein ShyY1
LALVIVFALVTTLLSWWQFSRREERVAKIETVLSNYDSPVVDLANLSWDMGPGAEPKQEWRPVQVTGRYLSDKALLVRNRPLSGNPGFLQLVPFELVDGRVLVVERGWLPASTQITVPEYNPIPTQEVRQIVVRLRAGEADLARPAVAGQLASIDLGAVANLEPSRNYITDYYGRLVSEQPASAELPIPMPKPSLDEGNHLSYALQWLLFGIMAFAALIWAVRNDRRLRLEAQGLLVPQPRKRTQADDDAAFEDANQ